MHDNNGTMRCDASAIARQITTITELALDSDRGLTYPRMHRRVAVAIAARESREEGSSDEEELGSLLSLEADTSTVHTPALVACVS